MTSRPTKPCVRCGELFERNRSYSHAQWERASYCSNLCRGADLRHERMLCACGCGGRVSKPQSRWCQGHNPHPERVRVFQLATVRGKSRWYVPTRDGGRVAWYRIVMRDVLGRDLAPGEVVHHINGDSTDDRSENLQLFASHAEHMRAEFADGNLRPVHALTGGLAGSEQQGRIGEWSCA